MNSIKEWLELMQEHRASDLHLSAGSVPYMRIDGDLVKIDHGVLSDRELRAMLYDMLTEEQKRLFEQEGSLDFGWDNSVVRYRCNYFLHHRGIGAAFREIPAGIRSIEELGLPDVLKSFALSHKGLVLITGPAGSGKSTTLAAMIDYINQNRHAHVITIEDPVEFVHQDKKCLINQREVGKHTPSFASALRAALREDPNVILVGEMRDLETISLAVEAAATGHLVLSTLHTIGTAKTVDRIVEVFPPEEQNHIRSLLADVIRGVVSQVLLKRRNRVGRVVAVEVMVANTAIRTLIREGKTHRISALIQTGKKQGMQSIDDAIVHLVKTGMVSLEEASTHLSEDQSLAMSNKL